MLTVLNKAGKSNPMDELTNLEVIVEPNTRSYSISSREVEFVNNHIFLYLRGKAEKCGDRYKFNSFEQSEEFLKLAQHFNYIIATRCYSVIALEAQKHFRLPD